MEIGGVDLPIPIILPQENLPKGKPCDAVVPSPTVDMPECTLLVIDLPLIA